MYIRVKVFPQSKKECLKDLGKGRFECFVRPKARQGEANERVLQIVKEHFKEALGVRIVRGVTTQNKTIEIFEPQENLL